MRGLADPENFFLHFGHSLESTLDGQVASRDHHAESFPAHGGQQQGWKLVERLPRLDLQDDSDLVGVQLGQPVLQLMNVFGMANERELHEVRVNGDKRQIIDVLRGQRREPQVRVREIDALSCCQLLLCLPIIQFFLKTLTLPNSRG